jgi:hypothetical protein
MQSKHLVLCGTVIVALAGCGGDDSSDSSDAATEQSPKTAEAPAATETAPKAAGGLPEPGAEKLTAAQKAELLAKNNEVALGDDPPSATGPVVAENFRSYAKPLAAGACKQALSASADTWEALAKADAAGDAAKKEELGQTTLKNSTRVFSDC